MKFKVKTVITTTFETEVHAVDAGSAMQQAHDKYMKNPGGAVSTKRVRVSNDQTKEIIEVINEI